MHILFYLDPGSGSFLLQLLLAVILGGAFAVKMYWKKIKAFFNRTSTAGSQTENILDKDTEKKESNEQQ